jgi:hypothetical protein
MFSLASCGFIRNVAGQFAAIKYRSEMYCWTENLNREYITTLGTQLEFDGQAVGVFREGTYDWNWRTRTHTKH